MLKALSTYPETINLLLERYQAVTEKQMRLSDVIVNFRETSDEIRVAYPSPGADAKDKDKDKEDVDTGPDLEEVKRRVMAMQKQYGKALKAIHAAGGIQDKKAKAEMEKVSEIFLEFKFAPAFIASLVAGFRGQVERIRSLERQVRDICVKNCKMPRTTFIQSFPGRETDETWLPEMMKAKKPYVDALKERQPEIEMIQTRIEQISVSSMLAVHEIKEINRKMSIGEAKDRRAIMDKLDSNQLADTVLEPENLLKSPDDAPVIRLINAILTDAVRKNASDVHIEPFENRLTVRCRVDGVMQKLLDPPCDIAPLIIARLKAMAKLDIAERRTPQDGPIGLRVAGRRVDVRMFTFPTGYGERVVLRLLDKQASRLDLEHLGMPDTAHTTLSRMLTESHGIILVTGPTDSGKTTTLYALLSRLKKSRRRILTIEDPIEYDIDGIGQTQVNNIVELDFAAGLRAILRQDPDIVMVGEIRDSETAEIAVQASLTGHLVLSKLHTNTAIGAVTRLRDMGVEPFLLASSLVGLVAQRVVRVLCPHCKKRSSTLTGAELKILRATISQATKIYTPHGCEQCNHTGYNGRTGIYEVVEVDEQMRTMIHVSESEHDMEKYARTRHPGIHDDGARLVLEGKTSIEELLRVTRELAISSDPPVFTNAMALKVKELIEGVLTASLHNLSDSIDYPDVFSVWG